jgi:gas vesicle protein
MSDSLISAIVGAIVAILCVMLGATLTSNSQRNRRAADFRSDLYRQMIDATIQFKPDEDLDYRVSLQTSETLADKWRQHWRDIENNYSDLDPNWRQHWGWMGSRDEGYHYFRCLDIKVRTLVKSIEKEMNRPLLHEARTKRVATLFALMCVLWIEAVRTYALAYPPFDPYIPTKIIIMGPDFNHERKIAGWLQSHRVNESDIGPWIVCAMLMSRC